ncbi:hypothetical protein [Amycolatopsis nigrescens]|uniref:hypothetical protein n=1 Tax=Amycolatopsis nigrescens TaxID=381445 RepID=UPI00037BBE84|nr:hypothetical protein [Amycolatopsis nigrescens]
MRLISRKVCGHCLIAARIVFPASSAMLTIVTFSEVVDSLTALSIGLPRLPRQQAW